MAITVWQSQALCSGKTDLFFGSSTERASERRKREKEAKSICAQCPVLNECRSYIQTHSEYGIWAGMTEEERQHLGYSLPSASLRRKFARRKKLIDANEA